MVSLFTKVPVKESLNIIKSKLKPPNFIIDLIDHCISNTYFSFEDQIYKQIQGAPMGSPLSPVLANIYMEEFEQKALATSTLKPSLWLRYIDDIFVIWPHGQSNLNTFLTHMNNQHENIKFTIEIETNNQLAFLDLMLYKKSNEELGHHLFRKKTHTNRYLHADSHHHPSQIASVPITLAIRSKKLCDNLNLNDEMNNLHSALVQNGYSNYMINKYINYRKKQNSEVSTHPISLVHLPYIRGTTDKISKLLYRHNIKTIFGTDKKIGNFLRNIKDHCPLEVHGVYEIPCGSCTKTYVGQTNRRVSSRIYEHKIAVRNKDKSSTLAQHVIEHNHTIDFDSSVVLAQEKYTVPRIYREAIEITRRSHAMNKRDDAQRLPNSWKSALITRKVISSFQPST